MASNGFETTLSRFLTHCKRLCRDCTCPKSVHGAEFHFYPFHYKESAMDSLFATSYQAFLPLPKSFWWTHYLPT